MSAIELGPGREFDIIRTLLARWGSRADGIGDAPLEDLINQIPMQYRHLVREIAVTSTLSSTYVRSLDR